MPVPEDSPSDAGLSDDARDIEVALRESEAKRLADEEAATEAAPTDGPG